MSDFDRELQYQLHRILDPVSDLPTPPRRDRGSRQVMGWSRAAMAVVAAAATILLGAATGNAITGSVNPGNWLHHVRQPGLQGQHPDAPASTQHWPTGAGTGGSGTSSQSNGSPGGAGANSQPGAGNSEGAGAGRPAHDISPPGAGVDPEPMDPPTPMPNPAHVTPGP